MNTFLTIVIVVAFLLVVAPLVQIIKRLSSGAVPVVDRTMNSLGNLAQAGQDKAVLFEKEVHHASVLKLHQLKQDIKSAGIDETEYNKLSAELRD